MLKQQNKTRGKESIKPAVSAQLTYRGGPVLQNVRVATVFWGSGVQFASQLNSFYSAVINSAYYDWLSEYNTSSPAQTIGRGTFAGSYNYTNGAGGTIDDSQIQSSLGSLIDNGSVPAPDANTLYAIHFAPGIDITQGGSGSCQVFCAYHNSFSHNGQNIYYSVIPDQGGSCAGGCGSDPSTFNNTTSVSSHELVEATTDADVGQNDLAWYDDNNGEIGDICNAQQGSVAGYTVQLEWSNQSNACIATKSGGGCTPNCNGLSCGDDGCGGSCGTCPGGQTCANGQCTSGGCTPNCNGLSCGDDGCGGSCGTCPGGQSCSGGQCTGGGTCAHSICSSGSSLDSSCDPCAGQVCAQDDYCCSTAWDSICVGEVGSICGQSC
jgi:hypothetical protein